jgi:alpha-beta hydrolase superfamily lysophospholipase
MTSSGNHNALRKTLHLATGIPIDMISNFKKHFCLTLIIAAHLIALPALSEVIRSKETAIGEKLNLPVYSWTNPQATRKGIIVGVHGLCFFGTAFNDIAQYFADQGYDFYSLDMRGYGRWKTESEKFHGDNGIHYSQSLTDLAKLASQLKEQMPGEPIFCIGESLGANIGVTLVATNPQLFDGAILGSPCVRRYIHPRVHWITDFLRQQMRPYKALDIEPYITPYLSDSADLTRSCVEDPDINRMLSPADLIKTSVTNRRAIKMAGKLPSSMPILVLAGGKDNVFDIKSLPKFTSRMTSQHVEVNVLPGKGHLLIEHQPVRPEVAQIIGAWLKEQSPSPDRIVQASPQLQ